MGQVTTDDGLFVATLDLPPAPLPQVPLPPVSSSPLGPGCVFFLETSDRRHLTPREGCALESAARNSGLGGALYYGDTVNRMKFLSSIFIEIGRLDTL